jgi:hypothetical protein
MVEAVERFRGCWRVLLLVAEEGGEPAEGVHRSFIQSGWWNRVKGCHR